MSTDHIIRIMQLFRAFLSAALLWPDPQIEYFNLGSVHTCAMWVGCVCGVVVTGFSVTKYSGTSLLWTLLGQLEKS